jgi:hypothetical protein
MFPASSLTEEEEISFLVELVARRQQQLHDQKNGARDGEPRRWSTSCCSSVAGRIPATVRGRSTTTRLQQGFK